MCRQRATPPLDSATRRKTSFASAQDARDAGADALVFVRDSDRDRYHQRENDIERGIQEAEALFPELDICGGVAKQEIEAWILALLGENRSESHSDAKT